MSKQPEANDPPIQATGRTVTTVENFSFSEDALAAVIRRDMIAQRPHLDGFSFALTFRVHDSDCYSPNNVKSYSVDVVATKVVAS